ncbi:putative selenoprotein K-like isoform X2 [Apostichopus japonicus]|uniref:Putative selenoprotein K-like isoform X2 n=1 Tax=Stichopus japonicus TaxID=307972 RepID=A0A2G8KBD0_STIJA|nr:putative selenoprotein K-like isoform X2 [Apostichopus japonicus]
MCRQDLATCQVCDSRSPWRLSFIPDMFWGMVEFVILFFKTMVMPDLTSKGRGFDSSYQSSSKGGRPPPGPPRRRMGGFRGGAAGPTPPPAAGGG